MLFHFYIIATFLLTDSFPLITWTIDIPFGHPAVLILVMRPSAWDVAYILPELPFEIFI